MHCTPLTNQSLDCPAPLIDLVIARGPLQYVQDARLSNAQRRLLTLAKEKGSSSWLSVIPVGEHGFFLNKSEFHDAFHQLEAAGVAWLQHCGKLPSVVWLLCP